MAGIAHAQPAKKPQPQKDTRPNILFIMSDDHTTQAIGAYGGHLKELNPTPHIDKLAANGLRFERVFWMDARN